MADRTASMAGSMGMEGSSSLGEPLSEAARWKHKGKKHSTPFVGAAAKETMRLLKPALQKQVTSSELERDYAGNESFSIEGKSGGRVWGCGLVRLTDGDVELSWRSKVPGGRQLFQDMESDDGDNPKHLAQWMARKLNEFSASSMEGKATLGALLSELRGIEGEGASRYGSVATDGCASEERAGRCGSVAVSGPTPKRQAKQRKRKNRIAEDLEELAMLTEAYVDEASLMKSLNSLVKYNQGKFKSAKQAKFLYNELRSKHRMTPTAKRWGERWMRDPNAIAVQLMQRIEGFGSKTASKVRMYGFLYVVDGGGVVRMAKANIDHKAGFKVTGEKELRFQRKGDAPTLYDYAAEQRAQDAKAKANAPMIQKLKAIPKYDSNHFLKDLVFQLEGGRALTPGQLRAVAKYIPVEIGDYAEWKQAYKDGMKLLKSRLVDPAVKAMQQIVAELEADPDKYEHKAKNAKYFLDEYESFAKYWMKKPARSEEFGAASDMFRVVSDLGFKGGNQGNWPFTGLWALKVASARKGKAGRTTVKFIRDGLDFAEWLKKLSPSSVVAELRKDWMREKGHDPFEEFSDAAVADYNNREGW
jgi:hypothetical protein